MLVIKSDGSKVPFDSSKPRKWIQWSVDGLENQVQMEYNILTETLKQLPPEVTTDQIHKIIIKVCLSKEDIVYSRVAARLEHATILKNIERELGVYKPQSKDFTDLLDIYTLEGLWEGDWVYDPDLTDKQDTLNAWYIELDSIDLEYWTIKQWSDKYSRKRKNLAMDTPAAGILANCIAMHGVTELAFLTAKDILQSKTNMPTPWMNGCRNGDFDTISCCVIEGGDTVDSLDVAEYVASKMTSKKAGIGITLDCRSKGDPVKGGSVDHLGKSPLYHSIEKAVKKYTQISRGGSATMTYKVIDPDIESMLLWKTQRIDLAQRIDKIDYSLAYNDAFIEAILNGDDWYLFSKYHAPKVHENFHAENYMEYVEEALRSGVPHKKVKPLDLVYEFGKSRAETSRVYCINVTEANRHTPFDNCYGIIKQSNLCMEIYLPTKAFDSMEDLFVKIDSNGEIAFCSLAALNVTEISEEEYGEVAERALRTVDRMIELASTNAIAASVAKKLLERRSIGIGITGAAGYLYKNGLDYDGSKKSIEFFEEMAERHYYHLLRASQKMSAETGIKVKGIKNDWLPIDTKRTSKEPVFDWEALRGLPRMHSVLVAHMPCESSAVFSGSTNGLYPSRDKVIYKQARQGKVQFISLHFDPSKHKKAMDVDMIPYYAGVQAHTDQGISADYYLDYTKYENNKYPLAEFVKWFVLQAKAGVKGSYYLNANDGSKDNEQKTASDCESCKL